MTRWRPARLRKAHEEDTPFSAAFVLDPRATTASYDAAAFPGLIFTHECSAGEERLLISYWRSREHFEREEQAFRDAMEITELRWKGHARAFKEPKEKLFKRIPWVTVIATALAIIGGVDNVRGLYHWITAHPNLKATVQRDKTDVNYFAGDPIVEHVAVTNRSYTNQRVRIAHALLRDTKEGRFEFQAMPPEIPELRKDQTETIRLTAPAQSPGKYTMAIEFSVRAGLLHEEPIPVSEPPSLTVWSKKSEVTDRRISKVRSLDDQREICEVEAIARFGLAEPRGHVLTIRVRRHPAVFDAYTSLEGTLDRVWQNANGLGSVSFVLPPTAEFQAPKFQIVMTGAKNTNWNDVLRDTEVTLDPADLSHRNAGDAVR